MANVKIRGQTLDIDVREELEQFNWTRPRWTNEKLIAASPFRYDKSPSFFVNLEGEYAGTWGDSGAYDADYESGNLVKLLAFLRNETYEETEDYLLDKYSTEWKYDEYVKLPKLSVKSISDRHIPSETLEFYKYRHPYLERRGISEKVQQLMRVGYCKQSRAVTIPWFNTDGRLANIKFRKTEGKTFWYRKGAVPIRNLVYGIDVIYRKKIDEVVLCEAEIDAMSLMSVGVPAIAVGGVAFTDRQVDTIKRSPIKKLTVCADNDKAGSKLSKQVANKLRGYVELGILSFPTEYKDINEAHNKDDITRYLDEVKTIRQMTI